jgi:methyl-accepting chemotaxis protein
MQWLRNLPVSRKFTAAFGIVCGLCIVLGAFTFITFRGIAAKSENVSGNQLPALVQIGDIRNGINAERREDLELMLCQTPACTASHGARRQKAIADYQSALRAMDPLILSQERDSYIKFTASIKQYQDASDRSIGLLNAGKVGDALDLLSSDAVNSSLEQALGAAEFGVQLHAKAGMESSEAVSSASKRATSINMGATILIVLLCALTGGLLTREIAPRLGRLMAALEHFAA